MSNFYTFLGVVSLGLFLAICAVGGFALGFSLKDLLRGLARHGRAVVAFLKPSAFEERSRQRERKRLVSELDEIDAQRDYAKGREPQIRERLQALAKLDMQAVLATMSPSLRLQRLGGQGWTWGPTTKGAMSGGPSNIPRDMGPQADVVFRQFVDHKVSDLESATPPEGYIPHYLRRPQAAKDAEVAARAELQLKPAAGFPGEPS